MSITKHSLVSAALPGVPSHQSNLAGSATTAGRLLSLSESEVDRLRKRFEAQYLGEPNSGCWLWTSHLDRKGYGNIGCNGRWFKATHVSLFLRGVTVPPGHLACHKCDVPACVNPSHLFVGTQSDNLRDSWQKKRRRQSLGERHGRAKLKAGDVRNIRTRRSLGEASASIARDFAITPTAVHAILTGRNWGHLK